MKKGFTIAQLVGFLTLFFIFLILLFIGIKLLKSVTSEKEILQNTDVKNEKIKININGDFVTYVKLNKKYKEESAKAYNGNKDISDKIVISYFQNDNQVAEIDTKKIGNYVVKYEVLYKNKVYEATRVVVILK